MWSSSLGTTTTGMAGAFAFRFSSVVSSKRTRIATRSFRQQQRYRTHTYRINDRIQCLESPFTTIYYTPGRLFSTTTTTTTDESSSSTETTTTTATVVVEAVHDPHWKESPLVNPEVTFETLLVPSSQLTKWIKHPELQERLAKAENWEFLKHIHPRIKMVQDYYPDDDDDVNNDNEETKTAQTYKQLLLLPSSVWKGHANQTATGMPESTVAHTNEWLSNLLEEDTNRDGNSDDDTTIQTGPALIMPIAYHQLSFQYLLQRLLPKDALPAPSAYEQIGHVAHFNLKERHLPYRKLIGEALLASTTSGNDSIQTVVNKVGQVDGKFRTYECEILATTATNDESSSSSLETTVTEDGVAIRLNVAECYWCTRLSGERQELIKDILKHHRKFKHALVVADVFCGAGAVCMLLAKKVKDRAKLQQQQQDGDNHNKKQKQQQTTNDASTSESSTPLVTVLANDWNPTAIDYMQKSIGLNGMDKEKDPNHTFELSCRDSYDFLFELGEDEPQATTKIKPYAKLSSQKRRRGGKKPKEPKEEDEKEPPAVPRSLPDHVLMNFPLEGPRFLGALRWWSWKRLEHEHQQKSSSHQKWYPRFHVYTFARASVARAKDEDEMAVNLIANELLPESSSTSTASDDDDDDDDTNPVYRREEFDQEFGTDISTRVVRDVAPGKVVVLVSFNVTPKLIRYMQGDYS